MTNGTHTQEERRRAWEWLAQNVRRLTLDEAVSSLFMDPTGYAVFEAPALEFEGHAPVGEKQLYLIKPEAPEDTDNKLAWLLFVPCVRDLELPDEEGDPESKFVRFSQYAGAVRWADGVQMRLGDLALWFADNDSSSEQSERIHVPASVIGPGFIANDKITKTISVMSADELSEEECRGIVPLDINVGTGKNIMVLFNAPDGKELSAECLSVMDAIVSIIEANGQSRFRGTDLLKQVGITNPYQEGQRATLLHYAEIIKTLRKTEILIDTTGITKGMEPDLSRSDLSAQLLCAWIETLYKRTDDGEVPYDFIVTLLPTDASDIYTAFPSYKYAKDNGQVVSVQRNVYDLPSGRGKQQRLIRDYLARRIGEHNPGKKVGDGKPKDGKTKKTRTVLLDTICRVIGIDPNDKDKRRRIASKTESLLAEMAELSEVAGGVRLDGFEVLKEGRTTRGYELTVSVPVRKAMKKSGRNAE